MTFAKRIAFPFLSGLFILILAGCGSILASDVTPPPYAESYSAQDTPAATESIFPIVPPDPNNGRVIFSEKCAPCHGPTGMGDGPQSSDLPVTVPAIGDLNFSATVRPVDWYNMVTNGNMERYMPAFKSLDERQRWDVVAYALSLSIPADVQKTGQIVYESNCLSCHGEQGEGSVDAPNWQIESGRLAQLSLYEIVDVTANGIGEMPGYSGELSEADLSSVAFYVRSLSFASTGTELAVTAAATETGAVTPPQGTSVPAGTAETFPPSNFPDEQATPAVTDVEQVPATIQVTGKITAESGIAIPKDLTVTLYGFDEMNQAYESRTEVSDDYTFEFDDVEFVSGRAFMAVVEYQGLTYTSDVYHSQDQLPGDVVDLQVTYYETTTDLSDLRADRLHVFFDFSRSDVVQVVELFILNNTSDKVIVASQSGGGVIEFELPDGAVNLQFQDSTLGDRYIKTENGFADTASILPGEGTQILFAYDLPFERKMDVSIPIPMPVDAAVFMLPTGTMKLSSDQLQSTGAREVQGISLDMYSGSNLATGTTLDITLSGKGAGSAGLEKGDTTSLIIGGGVLGVALIAAGFWLFRRNKDDDYPEEIEMEPPAETAEEIMDAIITLDDQYKSGELPEAAYQTRRAELKTKLESLMK